MPGRWRWIRRYGVDPSFARSSSGTVCARVTEKSMARTACSGCRRVVIVSSSARSLSLGICDQTAKVMSSVSGWWNAASTSHAASHLVELSGGKVLDGRTPRSMMGHWRTVLNRMLRICWQ